MLNGSDGWRSVAETEVAHFFSFSAHEIENMPSKKLMIWQKRRRDFLKAEGKINGF